MDSDSEPHASTFPLIITFPSLNKPFKQMPVDGRKSFLNSLIDLFPSAVSKIGANDDLFVTVLDSASKIGLLKLKRLGDFEPACNRTARESELKKTMFCVSKADTEDALVNHLSHIGVIKAHRISRKECDIDVATGSVILTVNRTPHTE